jgi:hypothetical protein
VCALSHTVSLSIRSRVVEPIRILGVGLHRQELIKLPINRSGSKAEQKKVNGDRKRGSRLACT